MSEGEFCRGLYEKDVGPVAPQALWSAAACCRFGQVGLPAVHHTGLSAGREQAR